VYVIAREPDLVLAALELLPLPLGRRYDAALLAVDVEARRCAEAEALQSGRKVVDADVDR
jgi:hypothetical protein